MLCMVSRVHGRATPNAIAYDATLGRDMADNVDYVNTSELYPCAVTHSGVCEWICLTTISRALSTGFPQPLRTLQPCEGRSFSGTMENPLFICTISEKWGSQVVMSLPLLFVFRVLF